MNPAHSAATRARPASLAFGVVMVFLPGEVAARIIPVVVQSTNHTRAAVPDYGEAVYHPCMTSDLDIYRSANELIDRNLGPPWAARGHRRGRAGTARSDRPVYGASVGARP